MKKYIIRGTNRLWGEIDIQGCKNSALAILIAALTVDGEIIISGLPDISDVHTCLQILEYYGCKTEYLDKTTVQIRTNDVEYRPMPTFLTVKLRASSYLLGALISRFGKCELPKSGGCNFGVRPLNYHIDALKTLGAFENEENGTISASCGLKGGLIRFPYKTVGGTVNALIASAKASGTTVICNAAKEPHINDLAGFLNSCGAEIYGAGTDIITVKGVNSLNGNSYTVDTDMIEAGTFLIAAMATNGKIRCNSAPVFQLRSVLEVLERIGADIEIGSDNIIVSASALLATDVITEPYPSFPTDLQPQISTLLGIAKGESSVRETVFESRFAYLSEIEKCGMKYKIQGDTLKISGVEHYCCADMTATDLRGGAAAVIAALNANGKSEIDNIALIERGYSSFHTKLASLGADIIKR